MRRDVLGKPTTNGSIVAALDDSEHGALDRWKITDKGSRSTRRTPVPELGLKQDRRSGKPANNRFINGKVSEQSDKT